MCRVSRPGARQLRQSSARHFVTPYFAATLLSPGIPGENGGTDYWVKQQTDRKMEKMGMLCIVSLHSYCRMGLKSAMVIYFSIEISYNYFQVGGTGPVTRWPVCLI